MNAAPLTHYTKVKHATLWTLWRHQDLRHHVEKLKKSGKYTIESLEISRNLWWQSRYFADLAFYLRFRRALGFSLTKRRAEQLTALVSLSLIQRVKLLISPNTHAIFCYLLDEYNQQFSTKCAWLQAQLQHQSSRKNQLIWQLQGKKRIAIVGNSPLLKGTALGESIDSADIVIRFNHCFSPYTSEADIGKKTDIWVVAPSFRGPIVEAEHIILSGPSMLWQLRNLTYLQKIKQDILHVDILSWRKLVWQFSAPPSAAPLIVQMLLDNNISSSSLEIYGVTPLQAIQTENNNQQYHHAVPHHTPSNRHNWIAESNFWQQLNR